MERVYTKKEVYVVLKELETELMSELDMVSFELEEGLSSLREMDNYIAKMFGRIGDDCEIGTKEWRMMKDMMNMRRELYHAYASFKNVKERL